MRRTLISLPIILIGAFLTPAIADDVNATELGIVTGPSSGTQIQFGRDIAAVAKTAGLEILVKESQGSVDNVKRMDSKENAALGIVYADVLGFLEHAETPELRHIADRLRMIFPFYHAEVHLLANRSIQSLNDLKGKRVIAGEEGSGTWITSTNILQLAGVEPSMVIHREPIGAVTAVLKGEADAMFFVAGKPIQLFTKVGKLAEKPEYAEMLSKLHFVPMTDQRLLREYASAEITTADYDWVKASIKTVAVQAILMSFDFSSKKNPYFTRRCQQLGVLGHVLRDQLATLRQNGHAKWKEVHLDDTVHHWKVDRCSRENTPVQGKAPATPDVRRALEKQLMKP